MSVPAFTHTSTTLKTGIPQLMAEPETDPMKAGKNAAGRLCSRVTTGKGALNYLRGERLQRLTQGACLRAFASEPPEPERDAELDFRGSQFNALKALRTAGLQTPDPSAKPLANFSKCRFLLPACMAEACEARPQAAEPLHDALEKKLEAARKAAPFKAAKLQALAEERSCTLQRIADQVKAGPLLLLKQSMAAQQQVRVTTRHARGIRGIATGRLLAFDKFMNLVMADVEEEYVVRLRVQKERIIRKLVPVAPDISAHHQAQAASQTETLSAGALERGAEDGGTASNVPKLFSTAEATSQAADGQDSRLGAQLAALEAGTADLDQACDQQGVQRPSEVADFVESEAARRSILDIVNSLLYIDDSSGEPPGSGSFESPKHAQDLTGGDRHDMWAQSLAPSPDQYEDTHKTARLAPRKRNRAQATAAQNRYRERLKTKKVQAEQEMEDMQKRIAELKEHNAGLARRQRIMHELARQSEFQLCVLVNNASMQPVELKLLLNEYAMLMQTVGLAATAEDARQWTLNQWLHDLFPRYIQYLRTLLPEAQSDPCSQAFQKIHAIVIARRNHEAQRSVYMKLHRAFFAWNQQHSRQLASKERPPPSFWLKVVEELKLTEAQEKQILELREGVLSWLIRSQELRSQAYDQLGRETIMMAVEEREKGEGVQMLRSALELERRACGIYWWVLIQEVLTPLQEAWLDAGPMLYPWVVDTWALGEAVAAKHDQEPAPNLDVLLHTPPGLVDVMPSMSAFQLLTAPCTAHGSGTQLKRGLLCCWYLSTGKYLQAIEGALHLPRPDPLEDRTLEELQATLCVACNHRPPDLPLYFLD
ncbi:hypothetical protein WJX73_010103 [Symbiochloris irregularis]|uniref:LSM domain-containing protein n=1 Tax=Symbiochloris irregularis TaxID=706552 RepID=A0AAW1NT08_9CHLO